MVADTVNALEMPDLPAGSYDRAKLGDMLEKAGKIDDAAKRADFIAKGIADLNETPFDTSDLQPGEKIVERETVFNEGTDQEVKITEMIRVSDPKLLAQQVKTGEVDPATVSPPTSTTAAAGTAPAVSKE